MREESKKLVEAMKDYPLYYKDENFEGFKLAGGFSTDTVIGRCLQDSHTFNKTYYTTTTYHGGGDGTADEDWSDSLNNAGVSWSYHNVSLTLHNSSPKHYAETTCTATANGTVSWSASDYYKAYPYNYITVTSHGLLYIKKNDEFVVEALDLGTTEGLNSSSGSIDVVNGDIITAYFLGASAYDGINTGSFIDLEMKLVEVEYNVKSSSTARTLYSGEVTLGDKQCTSYSLTPGSIITGKGYAKVELLYYTNVSLAYGYESYGFSTKDIFYIKKDGKEFEFTKDNMYWPAGIYEIWASKDFDKNISNTTDTVKSIIDEFSVNISPVTFGIDTYNDLSTIKEDIMSCIEDLNISKEVVLPLYVNNYYGLLSSYKKYDIDLYLKLDNVDNVNFEYISGDKVKYLTLDINNSYFSSNKTTFPNVEEVTIYNLSNCRLPYLFKNNNNLKSVIISDSSNISFDYNENNFMFSGCKTLAKNLGRDGMINLKKRFGYDEDYRALFFDCPYNKTIPSEYGSFDIQNRYNFASNRLLYMFLCYGFFDDIEDAILGTDTDTDTDTNTVLPFNPSDIFSYANKNFYINFITDSTYQSFWPDIFTKIKTIMGLCCLDKFDLCCNYKDSNLSYDSNGANSAKNFNTILKEAKTTDLCDIYCNKISTTSVSSDRNCDGLFDGISNLKRIGDPQNNCCNVSGFNSMKRTFANCKNIDMIGLVAECDNVDEMFYGTSYTEISASTAIEANSAKRIFATSSINNNEVTDLYTRLYAKDLTQAFYQCPNITQISANVFNGTTEVIQDAFAECPNLVSVEGDWVDPNSSLYYQNYTMDEVTSKNAASFNDPTTKSGFSIPSSVINAYGLFKNCPKLAAVRNLKLSTGVNDYIFQNNTALKTLENVYLNEFGSYTGIFDSAAQNSTWKIWCPKYIKNKDPYNSGSDNIFGTKLNPEKVPVLWVDDGYIIIKNEFISIQSLRRLNYVNIVDPDKKYAWKFFTHPYVLTTEHFGYNKMTDTSVYYGNTDN